MEQEGVSVRGRTRSGGRGGAPALRTYSRRPQSPSTSGSRQATDGLAVSSATMASPTEALSLEPNPLRLEVSDSKATTASPSKAQEPGHSEVSDSSGTMASPIGPLLLKPDPSGFGISDSSATMASPTGALSPEPDPLGFELSSDVIKTEEEFTPYSPQAFTVTDIDQSSNMMSPDENESSPVEEDLLSTNAGSDVEDEDPQSQVIGVECPRVLPPPTLASDSPAELPDNISPALSAAIDRFDKDNDMAISGLLPDNGLLFNWQCDLSGFNGVREKFIGTPGPTFPVSEMKSPMDIFLKIWNQEIMTLIVEETNKYASQYLASVELATHSRVKRWVPTSADELYVFFAIIMHQSLSPCTMEYEYFYPSARITAMPFFKEYMPYNRFLLLKKFIHFSDNDAMPKNISLEDARLYKIQPIISHLNFQFQTLYLPGQNVAIDESLLKWCGHLTFIQKIATKAARTGIKSYELCESDTGYLWKFKIYAGKETPPDKENQPTDSDVPENSPAEATAKIVYELISPLFHKGYTLTMDNYYNSPLLARCLKLKGTDCYGTLRLNRQNVPSSLKSLLKTQLRTGDAISSTCGDLSVLVWKDYNLVSMISTYHDVQIGAKEKYGRWQYKPQVVLDYNKSMGGVDKKDQLLSTFPVERTKNNTWYKKVFRRLMNASLLNAFIIYRCKDKRITHRQFRQDVAEGLLKTYYKQAVPASITYTVRATRQMPSIRNYPPRPMLENNHFTVKLDIEPLRRNCIWCTICKKRATTNRKCNVCDVPLCIDCMEPYHTQIRVSE